MDEIANLDDVNDIDFTNHAEFLSNLDHAEIVQLKDRRLARIVTLNMVAGDEYEYWEVNYCHGQLTNGEYVDVTTPFDTILRDGGGLDEKDLVKEMGQRCAVKLGVLAPGVIAFE